MSDARSVINSIAPTGQAAIETPERAAAREALNTEARERLGVDPAFMLEVAQDVSDFLQVGFNNATTKLSAFFDIATVGEFEPVTIEETRGLKAFWVARGGRVEESQITTETWELPKDRIGFHVSRELDSLRANFARPFGDIVSLGQLRMTAEIERYMFTLIQAATPVGAENYESVAGISKTVVDSKIRQVREAVQAVTGRPDIPVTIAGRAGVMDQLLDLNLGFDPQASEEIRATGRLGVYKGANLMWIENYVDEDNVAYMPGNEMLVFGQAVGVFRFFGGVFVKPWVEDAIDYQHLRATRKCGGLVHHPELVVRVVDSTLDA